MSEFRQNIAAPASSDHVIPLPRRILLRINTRLIRLGAIVVVAIFTIIYAATLDNGLQPYELHGGDLITHQYAQVQARPSNAPGYPLYTMGGWLWFHTWRNAAHVIGLEYPNPMPILSSYSMLWALLSLWLLYHICVTIMGARVPAWYAALFSLLITTFFGLTYFFWYYATTTEQYSSAVAQTLAIVLVYLQWDRVPQQRARLYLLAFLCGISLAHMLTVAFIVPPLVAVIIWRDPSLLRTPKAIATAIVAAAIPLISYTYVYMRGARSPAWWGEGHWDSPQAWFWSFVGTAQGRAELAWAFEPGRPFFGNGFPELMWQELSLPIFTIGLVGIFLLPRRHATLLYGTLVIYAIFCWLYRFGNWFQVIIPAYPLLLLGVIALFSSLPRHASEHTKLSRVAILIALVASIVWRANASLPAVDSRNRSGDTALDRAAVLLDQPLPPDARVFAAVDDSLAIDYLTKIWGIRPDIKTLTSGDAGDDISEGDTIYATNDAIPTLRAEVEVPLALDGFSPDWLSVAMHHTASTATVTSANTSYTITPELALIGHHVQPAPQGAPLYPPVTAALDVTLIWQLSTGTWPDGLAISLRPTFQGNPQLAPETNSPIQVDRVRPLNGLWNVTSGTTTPHIVHDPYRVPQPPTLEYPADGLLLILYHQTATGFENVAEIPLSLPPLPHE